MGNQQSNKVKDHERRREGEAFLNDEVINLQRTNQLQAQDNERNDNGLEFQPNNSQVMDLSQNYAHQRSSSMIALKNQKQNFKFKPSEIEVGPISNQQDQRDELPNQIARPPRAASRYMNLQNIECKILIQTWYRDSHGLFDYEEEEKLTMNEIKAFNSFNLHRDSDQIIDEAFKDLPQMRAQYNELAEMQQPPEHFKKIAATCLFKDNNFWLYHKQTLEDSEQEKAAPGEKLWLVMRHMQKDKDHNYKPDEGYKLDIGDTVKFGRVRYKVIMMHNYRDSIQEYSLTDRFQRHRFNLEQRRNSAVSEDGHVKVKRKRSRQSIERQLSPIHNTTEPQGDRQATNVTAARNTSFVSQATQFDMQNLDVDDDGFGRAANRFGNSDSDSYDEDDYSDSENASQDHLEYGDNFDSTFLNQPLVNGQSQIENVDGSMQLSREPTFFVGRVNSVVPSDACPVGIERSPTNMNLEQALQMSPGQIHTGQQSGRNVLPRGISSTHNEEYSTQNNQLAQTGAFFFGGQNSSASALQRERSSVVHNVNLTALNDEHEALERSVRKRKKQRRSYKAKLKARLKLQQQAKLCQGKVCRICLGEENEEGDPLISPCKCAGTMSHIHLECLREWLNSKRSKKEGPYVKTYCWKALECELCKVRFPGQVFPDGTIVTDKLDSIPPKLLKKMGKPIEILDFETPEEDYIVIESVTLQNIRIVHVISMGDRSYIRVGRGHDADIRVTDISVSRYHAKINRNEDGDYFVEDNKSKFGTLVQVRKPYLLAKNKNNYLQMGRSMLQVYVEDLDLLEKNKPSNTSKCCRSFFCCNKPKTMAKGIKESATELYPEEWELPPDLSQDEEDKLMNTQVVEQTRDDDNNFCQQNDILPVDLDGNSRLQMGQLSPNANREAMENSFPLNPEGDNSLSMQPLNPVEVLNSGQLEEVKENDQGLQINIGNMLPPQSLDSEMNVEPTVRATTHSQLLIDEGRQIRVDQEDIDNNGVNEDYNGVAIVPDQIQPEDSEEAKDAVLDAMNTGLDNRIPGKAVNLDISQNLEQIPAQIHEDDQQQNEELSNRSKTQQDEEIKQEEEEEKADMVTPLKEPRENEGAQLDTVNKQPLETQEGISDKK